MPQRVASAGSMLWQSSNLPDVFVRQADTLSLFLVSNSGHEQLFRRRNVTAPVGCCAQFGKFLGKSLLDLLLSSPLLAQDCFCLQKSRREFHVARLIDALPGAINVALAWDIWPRSPPFHLPRLRHPRTCAVRTPMPDMAVTQEAARDIAAYLYTLR